MADPVSLTGLVISALGLTEWICKYILSCKDGLKQVVELGTEVAAIGGALAMLQKAVQSQSGGVYERTSILFCALNGCNQQLQKIQKKLGAGKSISKRERVVAVLRWPFNEEETEKMISTLNRVPFCTTRF
jgi:hypothetical protein